MGNGDGDPEWVEKLKNSGPLPLQDLNHCFNGWASPPGHCFQVRGPNYLTDKRKIPSADSILKPLAFDWVKSSSKISGILSDPTSRVASAIAELGSSDSDGAPFIWAFNLQVPSKENLSAVSYFYSYEQATEGSLLDRFMNGDDAFRKSRLKLVANIVEGPWIVKTAVGEQAICILGKALTCTYSQGVNFIEVDIDIGSSLVANAIVHLAVGYIASLSVDIAFLIESQTPDELPEQILGAVRFANLQIQSASEFIPNSAAASAIANRDEGFFGARIWKGFTTLLTANEDDDDDDDDDN